MEWVPPEGQVVNIEGDQGETVFWRPVALVMPKDVADEIQRAVDNLWSDFSTDDHRLQALMGALWVEHCVDEVLGTFIPGYAQLNEVRDFTFAVKVELCDALRLIPRKILRAATLVRRIRNQFAHKLERRMLYDVPDNLRDKLVPYLREFLSGATDEVDLASTFRQLVHWTIVALRVYAHHVARLRGYLGGPEFSESFNRYVGTLDGTLRRPPQLRNGEPWVIEPSKAKQPPERGTQSSVQDQE